MSAEMPIAKLNNTKLDMRLRDSESLQNETAEIYALLTH